MSDTEQLWVKYDEDGNPVGYAYGYEWVGWALYMDDFKCSTPEQAKAVWEKWKQDREEE